MTNTDQNGRFRIRGIAPGEYLVMALPAAGLENEWGTGFQKRHEAEASHITVSRAASANVTLKLAAK